MFINLSKLKFSIFHTIKQPVEMFKQIAVWAFIKNVNK